MVLVTEQVEGTLVPSPSGRLKAMFRLVCALSPKFRNCLGHKVLHKLRSVVNLCVGFKFSVSVDSQVAQNLE